MNIGDNGYTQQYMAAYKGNHSQKSDDLLIDELINNFKELGMPIPSRDKFSLRPRFKRVDILYNPDTKTFCGLHEELDVI